MRQWRVASRLTLILLAACGDHTPAGSTTVRRDSAGIRIVDTGAGTDAVPVLRPGDHPVWRVGWQEGGTLFERIEAGLLLPDGSSVGLDGGRTLRGVVISRTGSVQAILGGRGEGPGEFRHVDAVVRVGRDTVGIQGSRSRRLSLFRPEGRRVGEVDLGPLANLTVLAADSAGGMYLGMPLRLVMGRRYDTPWKGVPLVRFDRQTGRADTLGWHDWDQSLRFGGASLVKSQGFNAVSIGPFLVARGDRAEPEWIDPSAGLVRIVRWAARPRPLTDADRARVESGFRTEMGRYPGASSVMPQVFAALTGPLPVIGGLIATRDGEVWVQEYRLPDTDDPVRYHVLTSTGEWKERVDVGRGDRLRVLDALGGLVLVSEQNDLGVESVAVYELQRR